LRNGRRHIWEADCGGDLNRWALVWSAEGSPEIVSGAAVYRAEAVVIWHRPLGLYAAFQVTGQKERTMLPLAIAMSVRYSQ
jgi:hypothetical protein